MTYDFHGGWNNFSAPHAPLKVDSARDPWKNDPVVSKFSIDDSLKFFTETVKINLNKFTLGLPLYGRT